MLDVEITIPTDQGQCKHCSRILGESPPSERKIRNYELTNEISIERPICSSCFNKGRGKPLIKRELGVSINHLHHVARAAIQNDDFTSYAEATEQLEVGLAAIEDKIKTKLDEIEKLNDYRTHLLLSRDRIEEALRDSPSANYFNRRIEANKVIANPALRFAVFQRDGNRCLVCGASKPLTIDHIKPVKLGGTDDMSNLQTLCKSCNCSKGDDYSP